MPILAFLSPIISKVLDLIPDPAQRAAQFQLIINALQQWDNQQTEINKVEAANPSIFVSGWRPMIAWGCALAVWYQYIIIPFATWGFAIAHVVVPQFPKLDDNMWQLTFCLLGLGGLRSFEKIKGISK